jgi:hypothetical protein
MRFMQQNLRYATQIISWAADRAAFTPVKDKQNLKISTPE